MKDALIGYSGFVGSNLCQQHSFNRLYNSANISDAFRTNPDLCVYAGVRAEKFMAAKNPAEDLAIIKSAIRNIQLIKPQRVVLISTIDVHPVPVDVDENSGIDVNKSGVYGRNRRLLESWVQENTDQSLIVRLPALFGKNLKKNFIYDMIHVIPSLLNKERYDEFGSREPLIHRYYQPQVSGFFKCAAPPDQRENLKQAFKRVGFSALNFTDSRASFQFYNLAYLWRHIQVALENHLSVIHLAVGPLVVGEIYRSITGEIFVNELEKGIVRYDFKSIHAGLYGGSHGYIFDQERVMCDLREFVENEKRNIT